MPRHTGPFQLVFREDRGIYYARFRGDDEELLPWRSTGLVSKTAARAWAQKEIKKGSLPRDHSRRACDLGRARRALQPEPDPPVRSLETSIPGTKTLLGFMIAERGSDSGCGPGS